MDKVLLDIIDGLDAIENDGRSVMDDAQLLIDLSDQRDRIRELIAAQSADLPNVEYLRHELLERCTMAMEIFDLCFHNRCYSLLEISEVAELGHLTDEDCLNRIGLNRAQTATLLTLQDVASDALTKTLDFVAKIHLK